MENNNVKYKGLWITLIVLLGLALRLSAYFHGQAFAYFAFGDEILAYERALEYATGEENALYLSQAKFTEKSYMPGSLWAAFWFNAMRFGGGPHAVAAAIMALNVAAIIFVYMLGCRMLGVKAGLWAALFMATLPWIVYYSVGAYNPEIMAFFSSLTLLALWPAMNREKTTHVFWGGFLPMIALQFHGSGMPLLASSALAMLLSGKRQRWGVFALGILAGILFYWPYFRLDSANDWSNTRLLFTRSESYFSLGCLKSITTPLSLLTSWCPRWTLPDFADYKAMGDAVFGSYLLMFAFKALGVFVAVVFIIGFARETIRVCRAGGRRIRGIIAADPAIMLTCVFLITPTVIFLLSFQNYSSRYAIFQLPALVMIPAVSITRRTPALTKTTLFRAAVIVTIAFNVYFLFGFFNYQGALIAGNEKFVPSFRHLESIYAILKDDAGHHTAIAVIDKDFMESHVKHDAGAISMYVRAREKESVMRGLTPPNSRTVYYRLESRDNPKLAPEEYDVYCEADVRIVRSVGTD